MRILSKPTLCARSAHHRAAGAISRLRAAFRIWLCISAGCAVIAALSFVYADVRIASYFADISVALSGHGLGSAAILSGEAVIVLALVVIRLLRGKLLPWEEALVIACLTSICAYAITSNALKLFFGVPNPGDVSRGARHAFNFWAGTRESSFPSGHMVLAGAFGGVFMRLYRRCVWPISLLLIFGSALLVIGGWHFPSDVITGAYIGVSAGLLAGEVWAAHAKQIAEAREERQ